LTLFRRLLFAPLLAAVLTAAACGGGTSSSSTTPHVDVPLDAVAVVAGTAIPKTEYDTLFHQYQAAYKAQKREFPKPGTSEYEGLKQQTVQVLVQRVELAKEAAARGITVTDAEVQKKLDDLKQQFYAGDEQKYEAELKTYGATDQSVRETIRAQLVAQKLYDVITKDVTVTEQEITDYYDQNKDQFTTPEQRHVAHILVKTRKEADDIYAQLKNGADFATLAKKYSTDAASAKNGGDLGTAPRAQWVKPFGDAAWALKTGEISEPVKSQFGWHIIKALGDIEPATTKPLSELHDTIKEQLLAKAKDKRMADWIAQIEAKYASQVGYGVGFAPPATTSTGTPAPGGTRQSTTITGG
jgi:parvulin-like peptidyl-prolyl isomerase